VHVGDANELAFTPFGLDVLPRLADVCLRVRGVLELEKAQVEAERPASVRDPVAPTGTHVRARLDALAADSDPEEFQALGKTTDGDTQRIKDIRKALGSDPALAARELRVRRNRIEPGFPR